MSTIIPKQQHYSTVTKTWNACSADKKKCRYANHRDVVVHDEEKTSFYKEMVSNALPESFTLKYAMKKDITGKRFETIKVAEPGTSGKRCMDCNEYLPASLVAEIDSFDNAGKRFNCNSCNGLIDWSVGHVPYVVEVLPEDAEPLISKEAVKNQSWFHATTVPNWGEDIMDAGVYIHAGSEVAAEERIKAVQRYTPTAEYYVYELRLKASSKVADDIYYDDNNWPETIDASSASGPKKDVVNKYQVNRYVNVWETAGTVSLLSDPNMFNIVGVKVIEIP